MSRIKVDVGIYAQVKTSRRRFRGCDDCWPSRTAILQGDTYLEHTIYPTADCVGHERPYTTSQCGPCAMKRGYLIIGPPRPRAVTS